MKTELEEKIILDYPVTLGRGVVTEVRMTRPTMRLELEYAKKDMRDLQVEMKYIATLCDLDFEELHHLDPDDYRKLQDLYVRFHRRNEPEGTAPADGNAE